MAEPASFTAVNEKAKEERDRVAAHIRELKVSAVTCTESLEFWCGPCGR